MAAAYKTILIVYHADWIQGRVLHELAKDLYKKADIRCYIMPTEHPQAPDLRLWDMSTLTKIEFSEVERLIREKVAGEKRELPLTKEERLQ